MVNDVVTSVSLRLAAASDGELDEAIDAALAAIAIHEDADRAYVTMYDADGSFHNSHEWVRDGVASHRSVIQNLHGSDFPWSYGLALAGEIAYVPDLDALPPEAEPERRSFGRFGVRSVLQVPMIVGGRMRGLVGFNHLRERREWDDETIELVRAVSETIGVALIRRAAIAEVSTARDEAERANRAKDEFLSRVSHELRTPLHAVLGFAELLQSQDRPGHERAAIEQILASGNHLLRLVEDLLDVSRITSGEFEIEVRPTRIADAIERAVADLAPLGGERGVVVHSRLGDRSTAVLGDPRRLRQVVTNLVANAITYHQHGGTVGVDVRADGEHVVVTITDDGPGMSPSQLRRAFEPFERLGAERSAIEGVGIGLSITRSLVEGMGGTISLDSTLGDGTTATVTLVQVDSP